MGRGQGPHPGAGRLGLYAETAAAVDVVVVGPARFPAEQGVAYESFTRSPHLAAFPYVFRFGDVTVYRRTPAPN